MSVQAALLTDVEAAGRFRVAPCAALCINTQYLVIAPCTKLSPIESLLQYRFAISKPLKSRPRLEGCKIAPLRNRPSLFVVVFLRF